MPCCVEPEGWTNWTLRVGSGVLKHEMTCVFEQFYEASRNVYPRGENRKNYPSHDATRPNQASATFSEDPPRYSICLCLCLLRIQLLTAMIFQNTPCDRSLLSDYVCVMDETTASESTPTMKGFEEAMVNIL
jgi:hypothetical protein